MRVLKYTLILILFFDTFISAQDAEIASTAELATAMAAEPEEEPEEESKFPFEVSGFVDVYYAYSFSDEFPSLTTRPLPTSFTETTNSFSLGMANLVFSKEGKVGFVADLAVGPRAEVANGFSGTTLAAIKQLYVTYSPLDWLAFTMGNYGTHVGYEVIDAPANINYSTSYMFSNGPFYHTGIKADFALSENFGAMIGLFDDTDSKFDFVEGKHLGAQLSYSNESVGIYLNYIGGRDVEGDSLAAEVTGRQVDLTATFQASDELGLGINATSKTNVVSEGDNTSWFGAALYANYAFSDLFTLGLRGEYIGDPDGEILGATDGNVLSLTASGNFHIGALTIIPEFRVDTASDEVFPGDDGKLTQSLPVFLVAAVYSF
ncbi:MAG: porin [Phaeodactylibacter sp.]|nr:porin [Phaeodactylibacter sp.]MCB9049685.1 porin [Lewinellaceae bacterium]